MGTDSEKPSKLGPFGLWWKRHRVRLAGALARIALWYVAISIAMFPALHAADTSLSFDVSAMAQQTAQKGFFRDFFFITVVVTILGITNMIDSLWRTGGKIGGFSSICFILLATYFLPTLVYCTSHFVVIATLVGGLSAPVLAHDTNIVEHTLLAGVVTEIVIALRTPPSEFT